MANEEFRNVLESRRLEIVKSINGERSLLLDHLRANHIFDQEDCELIRAVTTNDARVGKLIDFLLMKGPAAYQCFIDVVQIENPTLYESLTGEKANNSKCKYVLRFVSDVLNCVPIPLQQFKILSKVYVNLCTLFA